MVAGVQGIQSVFFLLGMVMVMMIDKDIATTHVPKMEGKGLQILRRVISEITKNDYLGILYQLVLDNHPIYRYAIIKPILTTFPKHGYPNMIRIYNAHI